MENRIKELEKRVEELERKVAKETTRNSLNAKDIAKAMVTGAAVKKDFATD